jgi:hypothetical protein
VLSTGLELHFEDAPAHQARDGVPLDGDGRQVVGGIAEEGVVEALDFADQAIAVLEAEGISLLGMEWSRESRQQSQAGAQAPQDSQRVDRQSGLR